MPRNSGVSNVRVTARRSIIGSASPHASPSSSLRLSQRMVRLEHTFEAMGEARPGAPPPAACADRGPAAYPERRTPAHTRTGALVLPAAKDPPPFMSLSGL